MSRGQRIGFLAVAALIAIVAVIVLGGSGGDDEETTTGATQAATATPDESVPEEASPAEEEPEPTPEPKPPLLTAERVRTLEFKEGDRVEFRVRHDGPEHVHVHGYDIFQDLEPGKTATVTFKADITGIFEVELEDSGTPIGELKVEP